MINSKDKHIPVQLNEVINYLQIKKDGIYVDATFGRGGHSKEILNKLSNKGLLIAIDKDPSAFEYFKEHFKEYKNILFFNKSFSQLKEILQELNINKIDGILFDLGVSSPQIDTVERGFSYINNGPLDMRMNNNQSLSAYEVINSYSFEKLLDIFKNYGDIKYKDAYYVAKKICKLRLISPIKNTFEFKKIILDNASKKHVLTKNHFEKNFFQAIRIEVNDEINEIKKSFNHALELLKINARLISISFHSLEEKTIKAVLISKLPKQFPSEIPINNFVNQFKIINVNGFVSNDELILNKRSKSSKIKIVERINIE